MSLNLGGEVGGRGGGVSLGGEVGGRGGGVSVGGVGGRGGGVSVGGVGGRGGGDKWKSSVVWSVVLTWRLVSL